MSPSCKMHERLWIDTGPLISLHRQLPRSGVEPTPMASTAAAQIRGQREREREISLSHESRQHGGCGPEVRLLTVENTPISSEQNF